MPDDLGFRRVADGDELASHGVGAIKEQRPIDVLDFYGPKEADEVVRQVWPEAFDCRRAPQKFQVG